MKKILIVIILFLFLPTVAVARPADPSRFPALEPLLSPPEEIKLDEGSFFNVPESEKLKNLEKSQDAINPDSENQDAIFEQPGLEAASEGGSASTSAPVLGLIVLLGALAILFASALIRRRLRRNK